MADDFSAWPGYSRLAFESELLSLSDWLRSFAHKLARSSTAADDLVQTTYALALAKASLYDPSQKLRSWLGTVMHNAHVSTQRRESRMRPVGDSSWFDLLASSKTSLEEQMDVHAGFLKAAACVLALPERQRDAVIGQHYLGISHYDMQEIFQCPLGTVKGFIREGMRKIRANMQRIEPSRLDIDSIERGLKKTDRDDPYFLIAEAVRNMCQTVRTSSM